MSNTVTLRLDQVGPVAFEATAGSGGKATIDGKPEIGGEGRGMRPMEMLLAALASCSSMDVVYILRKQKEPIERLSVETEGQRSEATPARFEKIHLRFVANREVDERKLQRAVALSVEKYCSVKNSLAPDIEVTFEAAREA